MMHVAAYKASIATGATLAQLTAIAEQPTPTRDNAIVIGKLNKVISLWALGVTLDRVQWQAPSLRNQVANFEQLPVARVKPAAGTVWPMFSNPQSPMELLAGEELAAYAAQSQGGNETEHAFCLLADQIPTPIRGNIVSIRFTGTTTLTAAAWTNFTPVLDQILASGRYAVVGGRLNSATALAFRLAHQDYPYRPGMPACSSDNALDPYNSRRGALGTWIEFDSLIPPTIDVYATAADTAQSGVLDLIKIA